MGLRAQREAVRCDIAVSGQLLTEFTEIARELNLLVIRTPRGSQWYAKTIKEQLAYNIRPRSVTVD